MVAYTLSQLRQTSPPEFQDLDDEDLVREYARINNVPFEQAADYYGVNLVVCLAKWAVKPLAVLWSIFPAWWGKGSEPQVLHQSLVKA